MSSRSLTHPGSVTWSASPACTPPSSPPTATPPPRWAGESESTQRWGQWARPDAYLRIRNTDAFLEYDTGTESGPRVAKKWTGYTRLATDTQLPSRVLVCVPDARREALLADTLAQHDTPHTPIWLTTHTHLHATPTKAIWRPTHTTRRAALVDLA